ncbi:MAG TPA: hypothetical protein VMZ92_05705 [Planctomycetota bacterium]|nr:hypothetical protein [Planctomycetota bacterium]
MRNGSLLALALVVLSTPVVIAQEAAEVAVVSNVKILSTGVPDVSSLEAWKNSCISPGMSDKEKGIAIWRSVVQHQQQNSPPKEFLHHEDTVLDFIKIANVYGYSYCSVAAAEVTCLGRYAGMPARGWTIKGHCVPELYWDGKWHLLDPSLINYFPKPDGDIASVDEVMAAVKAWYEVNPDFKGNHKKLYAFGREEGGWGWKRGPKLLAESPFYGIRGWLPAKTHGWYSTMQEYDGSTLFRYESGYSQGYQVNVQLRRGMRLVRNWSNKGLYANMDGTGGKPGCMEGQIGKGDLVHCPDFGDLAPGRVGNGTLEWDVPLADSAWRTSAVAAQNVMSAPRTKLRAVVRDDRQPGVLIFRIPSSYLYLSGKLSFETVIPNPGHVVVSFSDNNGLDWKEIAKVEKSGEQQIDLSKLVLRRYDYRLKFEMRGNSVGLASLKITHDVQHSQRPLPALAQGENTITFSADPPESTVTVEASSHMKNRDKQLVFADFDPQMENIATERLLLTGDTGHITFPIETPGDMTRLRFGCFYWAGKPDAGWDLQVSTDAGKTFTTVERFGKSERHNGRWTTFANVPAGTRSALVRYAGTGKGNTAILNFRIDADYLEPHGGFRPVRVTYLWEEDGVEKKDEHVATKASEVYTITCGKKPLMKSLVVELAE